MKGTQNGNFPLADLGVVGLMVRKRLGWRKAEREGQEQFSQDQDKASICKTLCYKNSNPCPFRERNNIAREIYTTFSC